MWLKNFLTKVNSEGNINMSSKANSYVNAEPYTVNGAKNTKADE